MISKRKQNTVLISTEKDLGSTGIQFCENHLSKPTTPSVIWIIVLVSAKFVSDMYVECIYT